MRPLITDNELVIKKGNIYSPNVDYSSFFRIWILKMASLDFIANTSKQTAMANGLTAILTLNVSCFFGYLQPYQ